MTSTSTAEPVRRRFLLLDVFTETPLTGNALAVVDDADAVDDSAMLAFSFETRLAETTFVQTASEPGADYRNRIFSMAGEMPFAGHPSLGTAVAVARWRGVDGEASYVQQTHAGLQPIDVTLRGDSASAAMLQAPIAFGAELDPEPVMAAIGLSGANAHPTLPVQVVSTGLRHVIVPLADIAALADARPDAARVDALLEANGVYGLYVSVPSPADHTARVRMFGRTSQIVEDPATGSAAGPLCAYLHERLGLESVTITQGVEIGRRSVLRAEVVDGGIRVAGDVVVIVDGTVALP